MTDKIISADDPRWAWPTNKGHSKYLHLLDGNARELDIRDYDPVSVEHLRVALTKLARDRGLMSRSRKVDEYHLLFQVTGKR